MVSSGINPKAISFMSFTKTAAGEALRRLGMTRNDNVSTLHSVCYRLLGLSPQNVMDSRKMKVFCEDAGVDMGMDPQNLTEYDAYLSMVQYSKNALVDLDEAYFRRGQEGTLQELYIFHDAYESWKKAYGAVDFDDMLGLVVKNRLHLKADHMIIDEAQDLSPLQWQVVDLFSSHRNTKTVYIAGDDDQNLYSFSGADPSGMRKFEERFGAERQVLSQSWRVPKEVHRVAMEVVSNITDRVEKRYDPKDLDGSVEIVGDIDFSDIIMSDAPTMILGRTNYVLSGVAHTLRESDISYSWENEGGAWKRDAGVAIRVWNKLRGGSDISQKEMNVLNKVLTTDAKKDINGQKSRIFKKEWHEVMSLPEEAMEAARVHGVEHLTKVPNVELSTIHGAKGRECDNVILLTALTDRVRQSMDDDYDSETRVFYVGVTRAAINLTIVGGSDGFPITV